MTTSTPASERGVALIAVLLLLMLSAALLTGFTAVIVNEQRLQVVEQGRSDAFYAAHGGLEKLTSDLGSLFTTTYSPTAAQVNVVSSAQPTLPGITFPTTSEGSGYAITFTPDTNGNPASSQRSITTGTYAGFTGLVTAYTLSSTARTSNGGEVRLQREVQTVGIPLFQFGQFSETDLGFHAGGDFDFGGRVHTNGNLFLAAGTTLLLSDKVTAVGEIIRTNLMNGSVSTSSYTGTVRPVTAPGSYRTLASNEGSRVSSLTSALRTGWKSLSENTYNSNISNNVSGVTSLDLPLVAEGATPIELIRRPRVGEATTGTVFAQRYFALASLRILLSDTITDITSLPGVTGTTPIRLGTAEPAGYTVSGVTPQFAQSPSSASTNYKIGTNEGTLGGYIKIEKQVTAGVWQDVTLEILKLGIAARELRSNYTACSADPSPNAVIRLQRVKELGTCATDRTLGTDFWPLVLYDTREALRRENTDVDYASLYHGGVMHYIELDVRNLSRWFQGTIGTSGASVLATTGYSVYFSDRRGNRNAAGQETGDYGFEDFVNPASSSGATNGALDDGEDVNSSGTLDTYGSVPGGSEWTWSTSGSYNTSARPWTTVSMAEAQVNPPRFFRRALKLVNGRLGNIVSPGLTVAAENPVYIQGDYNANAGFGNPHVACSVAADAVTLLSNSWSDRRSLDDPHKASARPASNTWYRTAILAGKGRPFPWPSAGSPPINFGTDGGVHNFLRFLESWAGDTVYYRGSMASLYYNRQGVGVFKDGENTYDFPSDRDYRFDTDFLTMSLLPPRTPMFRTVNVLGFSQVFTTPR